MYRAVWNTATYEPISRSLFTCCACTVESDIEGGRFLQTSVGNTWTSTRRKWASHGGAHSEDSTA
jgi:hypothetical protein